MNTKTVEIETVLFKEHPIIDCAQSEPCNFDVSTIGLNYPSTFIVDRGFSSDAYCEALLLKICELEKANIPIFIEYQCNALKKPSEWLDQLETLIDLNSFFFEEESLKLKIQKLNINIQVYRATISNKYKRFKDELLDWSIIQPSEASTKFNKNMVKFDLNKLETYLERKNYLIDIKADYLETESFCHTPLGISFGNFIEVEMDRNENHRTVPELPTKPDPRSPKQNSKLRINGKVNIFVDVYYRFLYEFKPEGKPFIDGTPTEVANMIVNNFTSRDGKDLSLNTVLTMLSPGKVDKRPSCDKRFCLQHLIQATTLILSNMYITDYFNIIDFFPMLN